MTSLRADVLKAISGNKDTRDALAGSCIAVTGGTGFLGSWIAETVAALNDEYKLNIELHLYSRSVTAWAKKRQHLGARKDFHLHTQDVRSSFEFPAHTNFVIHAAGIPDNRVHASDPQRVFETTVHGMQSALEAATKLTKLKRFVCVSSGLVESPTDTGKVHLVYADAKRTAESLCAIYRSQYRLPISIVRPYTFIGPYQELDRPWAVNNFMRDALTGSEIRLHGDGSTRRSYLYGADTAWWTLCTLASDADRTYNLGSDTPISHHDLAAKVAAKVSPSPSITLRTLPTSQQHNHDFLPDLSRIKQELRVKESCSLDDAIERTLEWHKKHD